MRTGSDVLVMPLASDEREFVRRAGFALIAWRAVHARKAPDNEFLGHLSLIRTHATDGRNFVWKAVQRALRRIGKQSASLHAPALALARDLSDAQEKTARKVGKAASRELRPTRYMPVWVFCVRPEVSALLARGFPGDFVEQLIDLGDCRL